MHILQCIRLYNRVGYILRSNDVKGEVKTTIVRSKRVGTEKQSNVNLTTPPHGVSLHGCQYFQHPSAPYVFPYLSVFYRRAFSVLNFELSYLVLFSHLVQFRLRSRHLAQSARHSSSSYPPVNDGPMYTAPKP